MMKTSIIAVIEHKLLTPTFPLHWMYLLSSLVVALCIYGVSRKRGESRAVLQYLFPRSVWLHRSAITDYWFFILVAPLWGLLIEPHVLSAASVSQHFLAQLQTRFGSHAFVEMSPVSVGFLYAVALFVVTDFKLYWVHRWLHRIPVLWEFHKVHHAAEVLTPVTYYRSHPVNMLAQSLGQAVAFGTVTAVFWFVFGPNLTPMTIMGVNIFRFAFYFFGSNLRHSHIYFSFGSALEHIVISPAQHQVHHSADTKHFDRNFGTELAIWDWMFGTLYCAKPEENLTFGLGPEENHRLGTMSRLLLNPFQSVLRMAFRPTRSAGTTSQPQTNFVRNV
jgi:sterol desaturase/sphingolipid hydroxylase (fatty acid hydroxylase superfamily)